MNAIIDDNILSAFRSKSSFGKAVEYRIFGLLARSGLNVYLPMVDDHAVDAVVKKPDGSYVSVQIKSSSKKVKRKDAGWFNNVAHDHKENYWFIFYVEHMDTIWIFSSEEFINMSAIKEEREGKPTIRTVKFHVGGGKKTPLEVHPDFERFVVTDFSRILNEVPS